MSAACCLIARVHRNRTITPADKVRAPDLEGCRREFASPVSAFECAFWDGTPGLCTRRPDRIPLDRARWVWRPVASTLRASTIAEPIYGYNPVTESEVDYKDKGAIVVMAVDNLPCELPKDASEGFGELFLENVIPAFFNNDKDGILERAKMTENGKLTNRFSYLQDYVDGKE